MVEVLTEVVEDPSIGTLVGRNDMYVGTYLGAVRVFKASHSHPLEISR